MLIVFLLVLLTTIKADKYRILFMNYPRLFVNGKPAKVGDVFDDKAIIKWAKERQAIKVLNLRTQKRLVMASKPTNKKVLTAYDILTQNKHLSTHGPGDEVLAPLKKLGNSIENEYDLLDTIAIPTEIHVNDTCYFVGSYLYGDTWLTKILKVERQQIIIDRTIFQVDGKKLEPRDIELTLEYTLDIYGRRRLIKEGIVLNVIPQLLE